MYKNILIPVDMAHAEKAPEMCRAAKELAGPEAKITLINIVLSIPAAAEFAVPQEFFDAAEAEAREELSQIAVDADIEAEFEIRIGHPANDILAIANENSADLIVIASHRPDFKDYFIGSTAARVVRHAQCTVLVMR